MALATKVFPTIQSHVTSNQQHRHPPWPLAFPWFWFRVIAENFLEMKWQVFNEKSLRFILKLDHIPDIQRQSSSMVANIEWKKKWSKLVQFFIYLFMSAVKGNIPVLDLGMSWTVALYGGKSLLLKYLLATCFDFFNVTDSCCRDCLCH